MDKVVFISHSSKDVIVAEQICEEIEKQGIGCWMAPRDLIGGMAYAEEIVKAIKNTKIVLLVASVSINKSEQILNEIEIAVDYSKLILPFKIEPVEYNDSYKYYLKRKHWIEAIPDPNEFYCELMSNIRYLLSKENCDVDTIDDQYLISLAEKNKKELIRKTSEKRLSFGLSIEPDDYADRVHYYDYIKRIDIIDSTVGKYSSYRWLTITNRSDKPTTYIIHKECGENKVNFNDMKFRAKQVNDNDEVLLSFESLSAIQPNFVQIIKIIFSKALLPGESLKIFYRLDWPGEALSFYEGELSTSISLTRYPLGVGQIIFGIMNNDELCGFELIEIKNNFEQIDSAYPPILMKVQDDKDLMPLHNKKISGAYYNIKDAVDMASYRIIYKKANTTVDLDGEGDF